MYNFHVFAPSTVFEYTALILATKIFHQNKGNPLPTNDHQWVSNIFLLFYSTSMRTLIAESPTPSPKRNVHPSGWVEPSEKIVLNRARGEGGNGGGGWCKRSKSCSKNNTGKCFLTFAVFSLSKEFSRSGFYNVMFGTVGVDMRTRSSETNIIKRCYMHGPHIIFI